MAETGPSTRVRQQVEKWRDELLDLTGRNKLLRFRPSKMTLEVELPRPQILVDRLVTGRSRYWSVFLPAEVMPGEEGAEPESESDPAAAANVEGSDPTSTLYTQKETSQEVLAACASLARRSKQEFMDRGVWILYLGIGMLRWSDPADRSEAELDSPLLLFPVDLVAEKGREGWRIEPAENEVVVNPALWLKLESELGIKLPEVGDDDSLDVSGFLAAVRHEVSGHSKWTVSERTVLSIFSFHKEAMYRDLRDNMDHIVEHAVVSALARDPGESSDTVSDFAFDPVPESSLDHRVPPEYAMTILDADASQRQCVAAAREGRSFVMDGPPGTGKSQTIANIIAELIGNGKTVLFVSEKAAALDVVYKRLEKAGLGDFVLELHSHKTTRKAVATALGESLLRRPRSPELLMESDLAQAQARRVPLSSYAEALNAPIDALGGRTLHHLLGMISGLQHLPHAPVASRALADPAEMQAVSALGLRLASSWEVIERGEDFVWAGAAAKSWGAAVEQSVQATLGRAAEEMDALRGIAEIAAEDLLLQPPSGPFAAELLCQLLEQLTRPPDGLVQDWLAVPSPAALEAAAGRHSERAAAFAAERANSERLLGPRWERLTPDADECQRIWSELDATGVALESDLTLMDAKRLAEAASQLAAGYERVEAVASDLAVALGLRATGLTPEDCDVLLKLAAFAQEHDRPEAAWLASSEALETAMAAATDFAPLLASEREARAVAEAFEPAALDLDLAGLQARFRDEYKGLRKLGGAYKADRAALATTAPTLKPKEAIERIGLAVAWQEAHRELHGQSGRFDEELGPIWRADDVTVDGIHERLDRAVNALELCDGRVADRARMITALTGDVPAGLTGLVAKIDEALSEIRSRMPAPLKPICSGPFESAAPSLRRVEALLQATGELMRPVDELRANIGRRDAQIAHLAVAEAQRLRVDRDNDGAAVELLGEHWSGLLVDPKALRSAVEWVVETRRLAGPLITQAALHRLAHAEVDGSDLREAAGRWKSALDQLLMQFETERRSTIAADLEARFDDASERIARLLECRGDIEVWIEHLSATETVRSLGLADALDFCAGTPVQASDVSGVLLRSSLEATADATLGDRAEELGPLRSRDRDRLVQEFAELDKRVIANAAHRVMDKANARRPSAIVGVASIIQNEAQKKKRHMPVAELLSRTTEVAQAIKPCFMMSPLSVSQYLPVDIVFDLVIFDEASQVKPCDAVNALYRGEAMIVAGDEKQLPPSSFFDRATDDGDGWEEEEFAEVESVLGQSKRSGTFRSLSLTWHYRSRHENLIAFSNHRFYGGRLITFPSASETAPDLGVESFRVPGVYRRGSSRDNAIEAQAVVDRVFIHAETGQRSIGVVAFSEAQASLIEAMLQRDSRYGDPEFADLMSADRLEGLFIKNLENVQGDEREVIIFSVGYGPDEHGKMTMGLGPIINEGGWRRLNVAVTRARSRVEIVSSFGPEALAESANQGIDALRRYMEFAEHGPSVLAVADGTDASGLAESPFEESVIAVLQGWGHDVAAQVGTAGYRIDMAIRDPRNRGRFVLGIECDGAMYHSSRVARDRDRLREEVLVGLGWTLHRIWGPSWYRDRPGEERCLKDAIQAAMTSEPASRVHVVSPPTVVAFEDLDLAAPPPWSEPYKAALVSGDSQRDIADPRASATVRSAILKVVACEGPIVEDLLVKRVLAAWDATSTERRREAMSKGVGSLLRAGGIMQLGNAYCVPRQRVDIVRVPHDDDPRSRRDVREISDIELGQALVRLVSDARVIDRDEATRSTARLFGWRRSGPSIAAALNRVVDQLAEADLIVRDGALLKPAARGGDERAEGAGGIGLI